MTTPLTINGFTFKVYEHNTANKHYQATNGEVTITSKSLQYLIRKIKKLPFTFTYTGEKYHLVNSQSCPF